MARFTINLLENAQKVLDTWSINPTFALGETTLIEFRAALTAWQQAESAVESKRTELTGLMDARDDRAKALNDLVTRARSGFRAIYGADSAQYEQAGGTRRSERKRPTRKVKAN